MEFLALMAALGVYAWRGEAAPVQQDGWFHSLRQFLAGFPVAAERRPDASSTTQVTACFDVLSRSQFGKQLHQLECFEPPKLRLQSLRKPRTYKSLCRHHRSPKPSN